MPRDVWPRKQGRRELKKVGIPDMMAQLPLIIPALKRLRQENLKFEASLDHMVNSRQAWKT